MKTKTRLGKKINMKMSMKRKRANSVEVKVKRKINVKMKGGDQDRGGLGLGRRVGGHEILDSIEDVAVQERGGGVRRQRGRSSVRALEATSCVLEQDDAAVFSESRASNRKQSSTKETERLHPGWSCARDAERASGRVRPLHAEPSRKFQVDADPSCAISHLAVSQIGSTRSGPPRLHISCRAGSGSQRPRSHTPRKEDQTRVCFLIH